MQTVTRDQQILTLSEALAGPLGEALAAAEPEPHKGKTVWGRSKWNRRIYQASEYPPGRVEVMELPREWQNPLRCQPRFVAEVPADVEWKAGYAKWRRAKEKDW